MICNVGVFIYIYIYKGILSLCVCVYIYIYKRTVIHTSSTSKEPYGFIKVSGKTENK